MIVDHATRICAASTVAVSAIAFAWIFSHQPLPEAVINAPSAAAVTAAAEAEKKPDPSNELVRRVIIRPASAESDEKFVITPAPGHGEVLKLTGTNVRMRTGPGSDSAIISTFARGATFEKIDEQGKWIKVRHADNGTEGWMFGRFLEAKG